MASVELERSESSLELSVLQRISRFRRLRFSRLARLSPRSRSEYAIDYYLASTDDYVAMLTRRSLREAATFLVTGEPAAELVAGLAHVKSDDTDNVLRAYRQQLAQLAQRGMYAGPTDLRRLHPDGTWESLRLPGD